MVVGTRCARISNIALCTEAEKLTFASFLYLRGIYARSLASSRMPHCCFLAGATQCTSRGISRSTSLQVRALVFPPLQVTAWALQNDWLILFSLQGRRLEEYCIGYRAEACLAGNTLERGRYKVISERRERWCIYVLTSAQSVRIHTSRFSVESNPHQGMGMCNVDRRTVPPGFPKTRRLPCVPWAPTAQLLEGVHVGSLLLELVGAR